MDIEKELQQLKEENNRLKSLLKIKEHENSCENTIEDLIDIKKLENIFEKFSALTGFSTGFIRQDNRDVLISTGWTDVCKNYHRASRLSEYICKESNAELTRNLKETHQISMKECRHGMVDGATPVIIDGEHLADIFSGQVFFNKPDIENFKVGAQEFGYDMDAYLKAVDAVKIISKEKLYEVLEFLAALSTMIAEIGKEKKEYLKLNASLEQKVKERIAEKNSLLALFDKSDNVLFKWNNDALWSVFFVSESVEKLLGFSKNEFEAHKVNYTSVIHSDDLRRVLDEVQTAIETEKGFFAHKPYRIRTKEGSVKWILDNKVIIRNEEGHITHYLGYLTDITELKDYQHRLEILSQTDQLTQIKNRLYLDEMLKYYYLKYKSDQQECSIILIDIDYFKQVNDKYGHITGDRVLIEFAQILNNHIRRSDIVGRWGGEEFLIILPSTSKEEAKELAKKLQLFIEAFEFPEIESLTASFGIATFTPDSTIESLLKSADEALYCSKENGRNQIN